MEQDRASALCEYLQADLHLTFSLWQILQDHPEFGVTLYAKLRQHYDQLREDFKSAFPNKYDLQELIELELGEDYSDISDGNSFNHTVLNTFKWAAQEGCLLELIIAAYKRRSGNLHLRRFIQLTLCPLFEETIATVPVQQPPFPTARVSLNKDAEAHTDSLSTVMQQRSEDSSSRIETVFDQANQRKEEAITHPEVVFVRTEMGQYLQGLFTLKKRLPTDPDVRKVFSALEERLLENLHRTRLTNITQDELAERASILQKLDELTQHFCHQSFQQIPAPETEPVSISASEKAAFPQIPPIVRTEAEMRWPVITYTLSTRVLPVAYYKSTNKPDIPFITFFLDNSQIHCTDGRLNLFVSIEGFNDTNKQFIEIAKGEKKSISLQPVWSVHTEKSLDKPQQVSLHIDISYLYPWQETRHFTEQIYLHAYNTALLAQINDQGEIIDLTHTLAGWVTPYHAAIEQLLSRAAEHYKQDHSFPGYNILGTPQERIQGVRDQVKAIFEVLKREVKPHYVASALNFQIDSKQVIQRVRLPVDTLTNGGSANCLDGTVLFASLLELASLDPSIVIIPGHAFVAWKLSPVEKQYECLETTFIRDGTFEKAVQFATQQLREALRKNDFSRQLFDPGGFARIIEIAKCRARGIMPLE